jgi:hypothetical protein
VRSADDARYFVSWIDRLLQAVNSYPDWNTPQEKESVLRQLSAARHVFTSQLH